MSIYRSPDFLNKNEDLSESHTKKPRPKIIFKSSAYPQYPPILHTDYLSKHHSKGLSSSSSHFDNTAFTKILQLPPLESISPPPSSSDSSLNIPLLVGLISGFGTLFFGILCGILWFALLGRGRIKLGPGGAPGEYDDEQAAVEEEVAELEAMDETTRQIYLRTKAFVASNPPNSARTEISLAQYLTIQEKGVSAWEFEVDFPNANCFVEARTEIEFYDNSTCCTQTNLPIPKQNDVYYWEAKMFEMPPSTLVSVGLTTKPYPTFRLPGYNKFSIAYDSQGCRRVNNSQNPTFGSKFQQGDVVGVGYRPRTGTVFFTYNGRRIDDTIQGMRYNLFPTVGANGPCKVTVNFGQAGFVYIEANVKKWGLAPAQGTLSPPPPYGAERDSVLLETGLYMPTASTSTSNINVTSTDPSTYSGNHPMILPPPPPPHNYSSPNTLVNSASTSATTTPHAIQLHPSFSNQSVLSGPHDNSTGSNISTTTITINNSINEPPMHPGSPPPSYTSETEDNDTHDTHETRDLEPSNENIRDSNNSINQEEHSTELGEDSDSHSLPGYSANDESASHETNNADQPQIVNPSTSNDDADNDPEQSAGVLTQDYDDNHTASSPLLEESSLPVDTTTTAASSIQTLDDNNNPANASSSLSSPSTVDVNADDANVSSTKKSLHKNKNKNKSKNNSKRKGNNRRTK